MESVAPSLSRTRLWLFLPISILVGVLVYLTLSSVFFRQAQETTPDRAAFLARTIDDALTRLDHLPFILAGDTRAIAAIESGDGAVINGHLEEVAARSNAEVVYLMDETGLTVAASNHATPDTFVGQSYTFRPYFRDAMAGQTGRFFAVGVTTGRPGYFVSHPVRTAGDQIVGVAVVKIGVAALTEGWADSGGQVLVSNAEGIVLAATTRDHLFRTIAPLTVEQRSVLSEDRQFDGAPLLPLDWRNGGDGRITLDGVSYLRTTAIIPSESWTVHLLSSVAELRIRAALYLALVVGLVLVVAVVATVFRSIRLDRALAASNADRARLSEEVDERLRVEETLQKAQAELQRSSRLAALGQLSASITHELGQPISAMKNYLAAEEIAKGAEPGGLNSDLGSLVARMQNITNQLRFFATPTRQPLQPVDLAQVVAGANRLLAHDFESAECEVRVDVSECLGIVSGVQHRLEQVVVNLLRNALHATSGQADAAIEITLNVTGGDVFLTVQDNGSGLGGQDIGDMTEPFVTTKSSGEGMGLGLAISAQIVKDHGGHLRAKDRTEGGAVFTLVLPAFRAVSA